MTGTNAYCLTQFNLAVSYISESLATKTQQQLEQGGEPETINTNEESITLSPISKRVSDADIQIPQAFKHNIGFNDVVRYPDVMMKIISACELREVCTFAAVCHQVRMLHVCDDGMGMSGRDELFRMYAVFNKLISYHMILFQFKAYALVTTRRLAPSHASKPSIWRPIFTTLSQCASLKQLYLRNINITDAVSLEDYDDVSCGVSYAMCCHVHVHVMW